MQQNKVQNVYSRSAVLLCPLSSFPLTWFLICENYVMNHIISFNKGKNGTPQTAHCCLTIKMLNLEGYLAKSTHIITPKHPEHYCWVEYISELHWNLFLYYLCVSCPSYEVRVLWFFFLSDICILDQVYSHQADRFKIKYCCWIIF